MATMMRNQYVLSKESSERALAKGLADATWHKTPISKATLRQLLERRDGPAIRDTLIWFTLIFAAGYWAYRWWGKWWAILPFAILQCPIRIKLRFSLARIGSRHRVQNRLDEQYAL